MNILLMYDSKYGNTEQVAQAIAGVLKELGKVKMVSVSKEKYAELKEVDLLVVGSPTQKWRPTPTIQSFLDHVPPELLKGLPVAGFDTRFRAPSLITGSAAKTIAESLEKKGAVVLVPSESFFVTGIKGPLRGGEVDRAVAWAKLIIEKQKGLSLKKNG